MKYLQGDLFTTEEKIDKVERISDETVEISFKSGTKIRLNIPDAIFLKKNLNTILNFFDSIKDSQGGSIVYSPYVPINRNQGPYTIPSTENTNISPIGISPYTTTGNSSAPVVMQMPQRDLHTDIPTIYYSASTT